MATVFFLFAAKLISLPWCNVGPNTTSARRNIPQLESKNIHESTLDFTVRFGEINTDVPYRYRRGQSGLKRAVFASFPSVRREAMKKIVKSSIFRKNK